MLVKQNCSRCHAIGKEGDSPHPQAPPLRTLSRKYPIQDIAKSLAEGIVSGHPDMPVFVFNPRDVEAIIQYLQSIQIEKPESRQAQLVAQICSLIRGIVFQSPIRCAFTVLELTGA